MRIYTTTVREDADTPGLAEAVQAAGQKTTSSFSIGSGQMSTEKYVGSMMTMPSKQTSLALTRKHMLPVSSNFSVADIGSNFCPDMTELDQSLGSEGLLHLIDLEKNALEASSAFHSSSGLKMGLKTSWGDILKIPQLQQQADATRAMRVLQWVDNPVKILSAMANNTKPGGSVIIEDFEWPSVNVQIDGASQSEQSEMSAFVQSAIAPDGHYKSSQPKAGSLAGTWMNSVGINATDTHIVNVQTTYRERFELITGISGKRDAMIAGGVGPADYDRLQKRLINAFEQGQAIGSWNLYVVRGRVATTDFPSGQSTELN